MEITEEEYFKEVKKWLFQYSIESRMKAVVNGCTKEAKCEIHPLTYLTLVGAGHKDVLRDMTRRHLKKIITAGE